MAQNAAHLLVRTPSAVPNAPLSFPDFFCKHASVALSRVLGQDVNIGLHRQSQPRVATLRKLLQSHQLMAALPQVGGAMAYLFIPDDLARHVVAARLCAPLNAKPLSAIDMALCAVLAEQLQLVLAQWHPARPLAPGLLQYGPLGPAPKADWCSFEFSLTLPALKPSRLRLILPAKLAQPPAPKPIRPAPAPPLNPALLAQALQSAAVQLRAVLHRQVMGARDVADMRAGDILELPNDCLQGLTIELGDARATPIAQARLGAFDGHKMLKLLGTPDATQLALTSE